MAKVKALCASATAIAETMHRESADGVIMVGPLVWQPSDGMSAKQCYFAVSACDARGKFFTMRVVVEDGDDDRFRCLMALRRPGAEIHDFGDELDMAQWAERYWPSETTKALVKSIKRERAEWAERKAKRDAA
jgi:hypothetical protein